MKPLPLVCATIFSLLPAIFGLSINLPLANTLHFANTNMLVTWSGQGAGLTSIQISLAKGDEENALGQGTVLAQGVNAASGSTTVQIPKDTTNGNYYLVLTGNDTPATVVKKGPLHVVFGSSSSSSSSALASSSSSAAVTAASSSASSSSAPASSTRISSSPVASSTTFSDDASSTSTSVDAGGQSQSDGSSSSANGNADNNGLGGGQIAGITVGCVGALAVAGSVFLFAVRRKRREEPARDEYFSDPSYSNPGGYVVDGYQAGPSMMSAAAVGAVPGLAAAGMRGVGDGYGAHPSAAYPASHYNNASTGNNAYSAGAAGIYYSQHRPSSVSGAMSRTEIDNSSLVAQDPYSVSGASHSSDKPHQR